MENIALYITDATFDKQALADIYERYSPDIFRYASRLLDDSNLAEDCVSETFSRFLQSIKHRSQPENIRAYLYRTAHNWIIDHVRRHPLTELSLEDDLHSDPEGNPSQQVPREMERQRVRAALLQLSPEQRQVIELRFLEDWSHTDIAQALGKTSEATRVIQHRAVAALRQLLAEELSEREKDDPLK